ncbi:MAG: exo-alpha-sialidase [Methylococcaceae bacterium]|nr:exo-alpha-sialidase [Methylococcaceae bacterium]
MCLSILSAGMSQAKNTHPDQSIYTASAFGPDGRLWRLVPSQTFVSVDYSPDYGKTFSQPIRINRQAHPINLWDENPPTISVDQNGRVYVLYFADDKQANTSFFSQADDGIHFSEPVKVSTNADSNYQYQAEMLVGKQNAIHFLWHDMRDGDEYKKQGGGDLSIYYTAINPADRKKTLPEHRIAKNICSCCRSAMASDADGNPVILARFVYPDNIRDHGLLKLSAAGKPEEPWRVTFDDWKIEGCPTHGPALSIGENGRYHMTWFTLGDIRKGLFYAWSDDKGKTFSKPLQIGNSDKLSGRSDILALGKQVALTWKAFDGSKTRIEVMHSKDGGLHWSQPKSVAESESQSQHPALISDGKRIYMSWNSLDTGYRLIPIE